MRHRVAGRHLGRETSHRLALYRNLVTDLLRHERITTTEAKAKEIRPMAERIITLGRRGDLHARRQALSFLYDTRVAKKVFDDIGPRMANRPGGYLRITGTEPRKGDGARMAVIELVDYVDVPPTPRPHRVTAAPSSAASPLGAPPAAAEPIAAIAAPVETPPSTAVSEDSSAAAAEVADPAVATPAEEIESLLEEEKKSEDD